jgi:hypothetical protein
MSMSNGSYQNNGGYGALPTSEEGTFAIEIHAVEYAFSSSLSRKIGFSIILDYSPID